MSETREYIINTTSQEGQSIQTTLNDNPIYLTTQVQDVPQIQSVIQDNTTTISSVINNPFIEVTSVNGMTGDVITEAEILDFIGNHFYKKNTIISHNGNLYWAKQDFTSSSTFNSSDWNQIEATGVSDWADIQNKPNFATVATSGSYNDLSDKPSINNASLTIKRNNTLLDTFTANASSDVEINISVPTQTSQLINNSGFITSSSLPTQISDLANDDNYLRGATTQSVLPIPAIISTSMIQDSAITTAKLNNLSVTTQKIANEAVTKDKIDWNDVIENGSDGEYILTKSGSNIGFQPVAYKVGDILALTQCITELKWSGTTCTHWSSGSWTQYGKMATTTHPSILQLTNPTDSTWIIKVSMSCPIVEVPASCYIESGLCELTSANLIDKRISQTILSCNSGSTNIWSSYGSEKIITLTSGSSVRIGAFVRTSANNQATWKGGDTISGTSSNISFGGASCVLTATLIEIN